MRPPWISGATSGVPEFPRAWIIQTARHKAIDRIRRRSAAQEKVGIVRWLRLRAVEEPDYDTDEIPDDRLRLIFTCCHPALAPEAQVALTLRTLGGLENGRDRARVSGADGDHGAAAGAGEAQDSRRAAFRIRCPAPNDMPERLDAVLTVIYLIFNEGYATTRGGPLVRTDLCAEAIRLGRLVRTLMSPQPPAEVDRPAGAHAAARCAARCSSG